MASVKHATTKAAGQKLFAVADWNVEHVVTGYVPYTGATSNVNLGSYNLTTTGTIYPKYLGSITNKVTTAILKNVNIETATFAIIDGLHGTTCNWNPEYTASYSLGNSLVKWVDLWLSGNAYIDTLTLGTGSITDSTGAISFGDENLSTTGTITGATLNKVIIGPEHLIQTDDYDMDDAPDETGYFIFVPTEAGTFIWDATLPDPGHLSTVWQNREICLMNKSFTVADYGILTVYLHTPMLDSPGSTPKARIILANTGGLTQGFKIGPGGSVTLKSTKGGGAIRPRRWCWMCTLSVGDIST